MTISGVDLGVLIVYLIFIFGLAQFVSREKAGHEKNATDYFLASKSLSWWAIGASLIAANISAEQIVGMSGSGYAMGFAIASYEWMAAATLLIVGKYFLPIFLKNEIYTMPQFLEMRFGSRLKTIMAVFWLLLYVFVNLTSIIWLGSIAVTKVMGVNQDAALFVLAAFALLYQVYGGLKAVALTDIVQVSLLVMGGILISVLTLSQLGGDAGVIGGFSRLQTELPGHFDMILDKSSPHYKDLPGIAVLVGGMWIANLSYWGFNQYIIQRALAAKNLGEAQKGVVFAAFLKMLMPFIIVVPGIAAVLLAPDLSKPDEAYPAMMRTLPTGILGLVFAALVAAVIASTASKINSIATIYTLDIHNQFFMKGEDLTSQASGKRQVSIGRIAACIAVIIAVFTARPLLGKSDQAFQFIQEFTGFFTPGILAIFLLGLFWKPANENGAIAAAVSSLALSYIFKITLPEMPFMNRMGLVFLIAIGLAVVISLATKKTSKESQIVMDGVSVQTSPSFNLAAVIIVALLALFYTIWW